MSQTKGKLREISTPEKYPPCRKWHTYIAQVEQNARGDSIQLETSGLEVAVSCGEKSFRANVVAIRGAAAKKVMARLEVVEGLILADRDSRVETLLPPTRDDFPQIYPRPFT